jgi:hypothetical protein
VGLGQFCAKISLKLTNLPKNLYRQVYTNFLDLCGVEERIDIFLLNLAKLRLISFLFYAQSYPQLYILLYTNRSLGSVQK